MDFSIVRTTEDGLDQIRLVDERRGTMVSVLPTYGASLHMFALQQEGKPFNLIDNYRDKEELEREMAKSFKSPKLSPFPCRIAGAKYNFGGREYAFGTAFGDGTAIHGLLYNKAFSVLKEEAHTGFAALTLEYIYDNDDPAYPHHYSCRVGYVLHTDDLLEVSTTVTNLGQDTLPIADGWHPYFSLGGRIDDWSLRFRAEAIVEFNEQLIPTGHLLPYDRFDEARPIGDTFLDNCFLLKAHALHPACELANPANGLRVAFYPDAAYPYLQIYTPPSRESIAIENLSSAPDSFNNKMGLLLLAGGEAQTFTVKYKASLG